MVKRCRSSCVPSPPVCPLDATVARRLPWRNRLGLHVDARGVRRARLRSANEVCDRDREQNLNQLLAELDGFDT
jgi:hypothetical protein